ncbi:MAG: tetratricopeptide repeat protein [Woeseiaceae bacterium]|nr:tetratricopeptide repeat protein [Woeseiaceae bacterium]
MTSRFVQAVVAEVRRRKVFRAVVLYAIGAFGVLQVGDLVFEPLNFPDWSMQGLILTVIVGFPLVFVLTWCIELGPDGFMFDMPLWRGLDPDQPRSEGISDLVILLTLIVLLGAGTYFSVRMFYAELKNLEQTAIATEVDETPRPNSIAVLSFANYAGGEETDHFANGLAEEILDLLANIDELAVAARTSSFRLQDEDVNAQEIARILRVQHFLEGSVSQFGDRVRVRSGLVHGETGLYDWRNTYEAELRDIFEIQQQIAQAVVDELEIVLSVDDEAALQDTPTDNVEAYVAYVKGRGRLRSSLDADVAREAIEYFESAVALDPAFARAYAGECRAYLLLYQLNLSVNDFEDAEMACNRARTLDPDLDADIMTSLSALYRMRGLHDDAAGYAMAALAIDENLIDARIELGEAQVATGLVDEAEATFMEVLDIDPGYWRTHESLSNLYYNSERYEMALEYNLNVVALAPDNINGYTGLGATYWMLGDHERAASSYRQSLDMKPTRHGYTNLGLRLYYIGDFEQAAEMQQQALELAPDDHRLWGRLAESWRFVPGREAEAEDAYRRAAEFAEQNLEINPTDWETIGLLSLYYAHTGRSDLARDAADRAVRASSRDELALYFQALALFEIGEDSSQVLDALEEAVASNAQYRQIIADDPDLKALQNEPRFQEMVAGAD